MNKLENSNLCPSNYLANLQLQSTSSILAAPHQLLTGNFNPENLDDALRIFSLFKPFNEKEYCNDKDYTEKSRRDVMLLVHPDKRPFEEDPCSAPLANRLAAIVNNAADTLGKNQKTFCNENGMPIEFENGNDIQIPLSVIQTFDGKYGIDLKKVGIDTWGKDKSRPPVQAKYHLDPSKPMFEGFGPPIEITYAEAFEFVIRKLNSDLDICHISWENCGDIFSALTNIEHPTHIRAIDTSKGYISWLDVILHTLKNEGIISECKQSRLGGYLLYK